jgi:hypothetical protein
MPGSNYINWSKPERKIFFRAILVPMAFVFVLSVLMFVFPDFYRIMTRSKLIPFEMAPVDLLQIH